MKVATHWLRDYVSWTGSVEELAERLTQAGVEVEGVHTLRGFVVARVRSLERHAKSDHLSVCRVDAGGPELQVVCGAPNVVAGGTYVLAPVGTVLPDGKRIERAVIRGVESHGMLCSAAELGFDLPGATGGLLDLDAGAVPGRDAAAALGFEAVLDLGITPNRADLLSHLGVAREVAALSGSQARPPAVKLHEAGPPSAELARVHIDDPGCSRYVARIVQGVTVGPSPAWLQRRLADLGQRPVNNVVDVTNFVMHELGQPLHAFDLAQVRGATIRVRAARPGETLVTLDGQTRALEPGNLVIADAERAVALAGVMGGAHSAVSASTRDILIESARFDPGRVRRAARRLALHSDSSHRFERGVDPEGVAAAADRAAALIAELGGGRACPGRVDVYPAPPKPVQVALRPARVHGLLGLDIPRARTREILQALGLTLAQAGTGDAADLWKVPSARADLEREEDLIEEVARVHGYEHIPAVLPDAGGPLPELWPHDDTEALVHATLVAAGYCEAINLSFEPPGDAAVFGYGPGVALRNPLAADLAVLRQTLLPGLLRSLGHNLRHDQDRVMLFEVGRRFLPRDQNDKTSGRDALLPREELMAAAVAFGPRSPTGWTQSREPLDFYDVKGAAEAIAARLRLRLALDVRRESPAGLHPGVSAALLAEGKPVGLIGELHPSAARAFELPEGVVVMELSVDALSALRRHEPVRDLAPIPRFPRVRRDVAMVVDDAREHRELEAFIAERALGSLGDVECRVELFDVYRGAPLPAGKKSLAYALYYRAPERTLTDDEVNQAFHGLVAALGAELKVEVRQ